MIVERRRRIIIIINRQKKIMFLTTSPCFSSETNHSTSLFKSIYV